MLKYLFVICLFTFLDFWLVSELLMFNILVYLINIKFMYYYVSLSINLGVDLYSFLLFIVMLLILSILMMSECLIKSESNKILVLLIVFLFIYLFVLNFLFMFLFFEFSMFYMVYILLIMSLTLERFLINYYLIYYMIFFSFPSLIGLFNFSFFSYFLIYYDLVINGVLYLFIFLAFLVKLSLFMFHSWLIKVHVDSVILGSVILSSIMLKLGSYGLVRLLLMVNYLNFNLYFCCLSLHGSLIISFYVLVVGDMKVMIALSSIIHMNYSVSSYFTKFDLGFKGFYIMSLSHSLSSGCMFMSFGLLYNLSKSRGFYFGKGLFLTDLMLGFLMFFSFWVNLNSPFSLGFFGEIFIFLGVFCYFNYLTYLVLIMFVSILYNAYIGSYFLCLFSYNYKSIKLNLSSIYLICIWMFPLIFSFIFVCLE